MKPHKPLLAALLVCLFFIQCNCNKDADKPKPDNPYGLPNATQTGKGVFACRINGVNAIATNDIRHQGGGVHGDTLGVFGQLKSGTFYNFITLGIYGSFNISIPYSITDTIHTYCRFETDSTCQIAGNVTDIFPNNGYIILNKIDTTHKGTTTNILSGTFAFKVPIPNCDTLDITDGRFDISF